MLLKWAIQAMTRAKGNRPWSEVNSIATDTCPAQQNAGLEISLRPDQKHIFIIGCDSHGLQLLIKDILKTSSSIMSTKLRISCRHLLTKAAGCSLNSHAEYHS